MDASAWGDVVIPDLIDLLAAERQHAVCQMLRVLGMQHASASLYVEHVRMQTDVGLRFFVLLSASHKYHRKHGRQCADRSGPWLRSSAPAASAAKVQEVNKQLASSYFAPTMPFWLRADGTECPPAWIAHETMLKPDDMQLHKPSSMSVSTAHMFLSHSETVAILAADDDPELALPTEIQQPGAYAELRRIPVTYKVVTYDAHKVQVAGGGAAQQGSNRSCPRIAVARVRMRRCT